MTRCAKCAGPGRRTVYRRTLPHDVPESRCTRHGGLWRIPCCPLHYRALIRCREPGCTGDAQRRGLCWSHDIAQRRPQQWRNCPTCLRCDGAFGSEVQYKASGLCSPCYRLATSEPGGTAPYAARLRELNDGAGANVLELCRLVGAETAAERLGRRVTEVRIWASGRGAPPPDIQSRVLSALRAATAEESGGDG